MAETTLDDDRTPDAAPTSTGDDTPTTSSHRLSGLLGAAVALATTELVAGIFERVPSLIETVAQAVIDLSPQPVVKFGIEVFGTYDKIALAIGIVVISLVLGLGLGAATRRRRWVMPLAMVIFAAIGVAAATRDATAEGGYAIVAGLLAIVSGTLTTWWLLDRADTPRGSLGRTTEEMLADDAPLQLSTGRRGFVLGAAGAAAAAVIAPALGRRLAQRFNVESVRAEIALPSTTTTPETAVAAVADPSNEIAGLSKLYTPNDEFYRIDTAFSTPQIDPANWSLKIDGFVDTPLEITFDELVELSDTEADVTLSCVSNRVGGDLVGNAKWLGVPLTDLLDRAGVQPEGEQIFTRSVDGWTSGFPTSAAYDGRTALVAIGMNGEPLPIDHGFPARLVIAGLYGYVSATKWLDRISLTGWNTDHGYWIPRGWSKEGPIKTQSRIDTVSDAAGIDGQVTIAGVAWAPTRAIEKVECSIDGGPWLEAELGPAVSEESWRQWWLDWSGESGRHEVSVRATDGTGAVQTAESRPPAPNGATGHHSRAFTIRS